VNFSFRDYSDVCYSTANKFIGQCTSVLPIKIRLPKIHIMNSVDCSASVRQLKFDFIANKACIKTESNMQLKQLLAVVESLSVICIFCVITF